MPLRAGELNCVVLVQKPVETRDKWGDESDANATWTDVVKINAAIRTLTGRELMEAQQIKAQVTVEIKIRWNAEVTATRRVVDKWGKIYNIAAVIDPDNKRREATLLCIEPVTATKD